MHPVVELHKYPPGRKAKEKSITPATRSLKWYNSNNGQLLVARKQARLTARVEKYRNYQEDDLRDLLSSVLRKITLCKYSDGIPWGQQSEIINLLPLEVEKSYGVESSPIFSDELPPKKLSKRTRESKSLGTTFTQFKSSHPKLVIELNAIVSALFYEERIDDEASQDELDSMSE
ncbi:hypothetical protein K450DRAFT_274206 [Umbelopsis ramanniana AG]|uniref:Uncharacterized protein n=1 Tax=Umbelopsis ramanniana AG TaxID=1314678 RepID=A0AAD5HBZ9_UMBRA|nr:uncharacterized protein K450DRAFT_274206 [Umbelopsis ramanniana AG]KAI8577036.1 hypothetical protein K450DRAFT_274206 [Umbelopsis ramanniana AG]